MNILYLIIIAIILILFLINKKDGFTQDEFDLYVISMKQQNRLDNIEKQQQHIGKKIIIFDAVNGYELDVVNLKLPNATIDKTFFNNTKLRKGQMGCYLSHFNLYNTIKQNGYTIIFEDDFEISTDDFLNKVKHMIETLNKMSIDFDILFLGNLDYNKNHGKLVVDNIYRVGDGENLCGTQGYVVNNKNKDKIISATKNITIAIDNKIQELADLKHLNVFSVYPYIVVQGNQPTTIINEAFKNYSFI